MYVSPKVALTIVFCFFAFALAGVGLLMRKFDFSCMFRHPEKKPGMYIRWFGMKKIAEDTPENRKKYSRWLGNYFILFSMLWLLTVMISIWNT